MALCVEIVGGVLQPVDPQPADMATCSYVLQAGAEIVGNPFLLSNEGGAAVSAAIVVVWGIGFGVRAVIQSLKGNENAEND